MTRIPTFYSIYISMLFPLSLGAVLVYLRGSNANIAIPIYTLMSKADTSTTLSGGDTFGFHFSMEFSIFNLIIYKLKDGQHDLLPW